MLTFHELHARWPDLPGHVRLDMFLTLSEREQDEAWDDLAERVEAERDLLRRADRALYQPWCSKCHDYTVEHEPGECPGAHQPAGASGIQAMSRRPRAVARSNADDPLKAVPPHVYFEAIAGIVVPANGRVSCPVPGHEDRHPSCQVTSRGWRCWSCGAGGSIIDLGAAIYGIEPVDRGYHEIRRRLLADLGLARRTP
jgi:hypothetical protein